mmetsp:Transcript_109378/g.211786  ORF Transcript_109378/g.211786 Transcript_109378/m.211786 type:complete len:148 (+) Transcript_109378:1531-1974(+)
MGICLLVHNCSGNDWCCSHSTTSCFNSPWYLLILVSSGKFGHLNMKYVNVKFETVVRAFELVTLIRCSTTTISRWPDSGINRDMSKRDIAVERKYCQGRGGHFIIAMIRQAFEFTSMWIDRQQVQSCCLGFFGANMEFWPCGFICVS